MADINKVSGIIWAETGKLAGIPGSDILKMAGASAPPSGAPPPTVAVVASQRGWIMSSTTEGFASGTWGNAHQANSRTADTQRNIDFGRQPGDLSTWIVTQNKTARPIRVATVTPTASNDWTEVNPTGEAGYDVTHGSNDGSHAAFLLVGNDGEYASYFGAGGESITTGGDWKGRRPINGDLATSKILTGVGYNHSVDSPLYVAVSNTGRVFSSGDGGDGDAADWTTRYGTSGTSGANNNEDEALWEVAYGNDKWVAVGYWDKMEHITGSGDATSWGILNKPAGAAAGAMYGVDGDPDGNWVIAGASGYVWYSTDNAATWTETRIANHAGSNGTWQAVKYDGSGTWWLVGGAGYLAKSTDMINWTQINTPVTDIGNSTSYGIAFNTIRTS